MLEWCVYQPLKNWSFWIESIEMMADIIFTTYSISIRHRSVFALTTCTLNWSISILLSRHIYRIKKNPDIITRAINTLVPSSQYTSLDTEIFPDCSIIMHIYILILGSDIGHFDNKNFDWLGCIYLALVPSLMQYDYSVNHRSLFLLWCLMYCWREWATEVIMRLQGNGTVARLME